jgi:hypothetical protein
MTISLRSMTYDSSHGTLPDERNYALIAQFNGHGTATHFPKIQEIVEWPLDSFAGPMDGFESSANDIELGPLQRENILDDGGTDGNDTERIAKVVRDDRNDVSRPLLEVRTAFHVYAFSSRFFSHCRNVAGNMADAVDTRT